MEHIIIGTAGHIDHGKTALIRALTGRDTDTLKEEKKRGISIDLGFTYFDLPDGSRAGVIDVPGHEKFLSNMLTGVCGMDLVLLVIALDEGIMPQTREHMEILKYLNVKHGIIVLTKADLVEPEWADMMEEEIRKELEGAMFISWKCMRVSSSKGTGIEELKKQMVKSAANLERTRKTDGRFRMPIDRIMSLKGLGTVIAGTLLEGTVKTGESVMLYPSKQLSYIKSVQVHGENVEKAYAGQRCAVLLSNVKKEDLKRGYVAAYPESLRIAERLDVLIHMDSDTERIIKNQSRVHLYIGTAECLCRVILLTQNELHNGEKAYAQLVLEDHLAVRKGDHFVLRFYSPLEIIGGGIVLDECALKHKRNQKEIIDYLEQKENNQDEEIVMRMIHTAEKPVEEKEIETFCKIEKSVLNGLLDEMENEQEFVVFPTKKRKFYWSFDLEDSIWEETEKFLHAYHIQYRYRSGVEKAVLKSQIFSKWEINRFDAYMQFCMSEEKLESGEDGNSFHLTGEQPQMDEKLEQALSILQKELKKAGTNFIHVRELEKDGRLQNLFESGEELKDALQLSGTSGKLIRISDDFYTTNEVADAIIQQVLQYFENQEILSFASLRDLLGTSRKSAKPLMAFLDEKKITAWCGKETERKAHR